ncbi:MAG: hypothetical protein WD877_00475 [Candidatus Saccharimonadales bacterium]
MLMLGKQIHSCYFGLMSVEAASNVLEEDNLQRFDEIFSRLLPLGQELDTVTGKGYIEIEPVDTSDNGRWIFLLFQPENPSYCPNVTAIKLDSQGHQEEVIHLKRDYIDSGRPGYRSNAQLQLETLDRLVELSEKVAEKHPFITAE